MSKKSQKLPYVDETLMKKVIEMKKSGKKIPIKTWSRRSTIFPEFVDVTFEVHNGRTFIPVYVNEMMIGHKLGEFAHTRTFKKHSGNNKEDKTKIVTKEKKKE